ncbi:CDP-diacylglycerol--glycerol-3-phosphate 3-phosphatidyltransferase [Rickettsia endosymbiont of Cardiosporidium cionae]|nr:CDP-diacylglycerol--glycerol-3-phosphate 3-phosphatidyltransferase [Rickettsia endosymbiont of Cardiosporidium cionae]
MRVCFIPVIVMTFYFEDSKFAHRLGGIVFVIASITDFIDGYIARKLRLTSNFGKMFDPIADKILVVSVVVMLIKNGRANEIACLLILIREFIVAGLREFLGQIQVSMPVSRLSKIKTIIQMVSLTLLIIGSKGSNIILLDNIANALLWITVIFTLVTGFLYLKATSKYF